MTEIASDSSAADPQTNGGTSNRPPIRFVRLVTAKEIVTPQAGIDGLPNQLRLGQIPRAVLAGGHIKAGLVGEAGVTGFQHVFGRNRPAIEFQQHQLQLVIGQ